MKNMGNYHDLYLKTDVLLLADVFEKFVDRSLRFYKLDPSYYLIISWTMLEMTEIFILELISKLTSIILLKKD